jgi:glycosyltransferase involved in cell wall biosynthesis
MSPYLRTFKQANKMKIAIVTETYPPEINGVAMTIEHLAQGLIALGNEVEIVRPKQSRADKPQAGLRYSERLCMGLPLPGYKGLHFGVTRTGSLAAHWKKTRPDFVHIATEGPLGWNAIRAARHAGVPSVSSFHTNFHSYGKSYGYGTLVNTTLAWLRHIHNMTQLTFAPSEDVVATLTKERFTNVRLLGRGVDTVLFDPARRSEALRQSWGAGPETPVAVYVGRIAGEKNMPCTVEAVAAMQEVLPDLKFVLVGDGPERAKLQREHPEFIYCGMRRGEDLAAHYASADMFVFASETETFGNVVTEAMASALPVLAYNYAAPACCIREGESGRLAPFGDKSAYLEAARRIAKERARWHDMGCAARKMTLTISWSAVVDNYCKDVLDVMAKNVVRQA